MLGQDRVLSVDMLTQIYSRQATPLAMEFLRTELHRPVGTQYLRTPDNCCSMRDGAHITRKLSGPQTYTAD